MTASTVLGWRSGSTYVTLICSRAVASYTRTGCGTEEHWRHSFKQHLSTPESGDQSLVTIPHSKAFPHVPDVSLISKQLHRSRPQKHMHAAGSANRRHQAHR